MLQLLPHLHRRALRLHRGLRGSAQEALARDDNLQVELEGPDLVVDSSLVISESLDVGTAANLATPGRPAMAASR